MRAWTLPLVLALALGCPGKQPSKTPPADLDRTARKTPPPEVPTRGPLAQKIHYEQGKSLLRAGKPTQAIEEFQRAIEVAPEGKLVSSCYLGIGSARGDLKQYAGAVEAYKKVVALLPSDPEAYRALAIGLEDAGQIKEAQQALEQAVALDPDQLSAYQDLASTYLKQKDLEGAKKTYLRYELTRTRLIRTLGLAKDEDRRVRAAEALGDARDEATCKALGLALTDRSRLVRLAVIRALGQQRLSEGAGPLRALLAKTKDPEERRSIQLSLQAIESAPQPGPQPAPTPQPQSAPVSPPEGAKPPTKSADRPPKR